MRSLRWHLVHLVHNWLAHPLLPVAEILVDCRMQLPADVIFWIHDATVPRDDERNKHTYL